MNSIYKMLELAKFTALSAADEELHLRRGRDWYAKGLLQSIGTDGNGKTAAALFDQKALCNFAILTRTSCLAEIGCWVVFFDNQNWRFTIYR